LVVVDLVVVVGLLVVVVGAGVVEVLLLVDFAM